MKIFTIELSSRFGSIAVLENGEVTVEKSWEENFKNRQQLFDAMAELETDWESIDLFAVGRGPGAFSGMRIGFTVVNSLAAPLQKPVYALNSGAALAAQCGAEQTVIVGVGLPSLFPKGNALVELRFVHEPFRELTSGTLDLQIGNLQ